MAGEKAVLFGTSHAGIPLCGCMCETVLVALLSLRRPLHSKSISDDCEAVSSAQTSTHHPILHIRSWAPPMVMLINFADMRFDYTCKCYMITPVISSLVKHPGDRLSACMAGMALLWPDPGIEQGAVRW